VCVARVGRREIDGEFWWINTKKIESVEEISLDGKVILKWILQR